MPPSLWKGIRSKRRWGMRNAVMGKTYILKQGRLGLPIHMIGEPCPFEKCLEAVCSSSSLYRDRIGRKSHKESLSEISTIGKAAKISLAIGWAKMGWDMPRLHPIIKLAWLATSQN